MTSPLLRLEGVQKRFSGDGRNVMAVCDLTVDVEEHSLVAVVGPSGCGKTTMLKLAAGLLEPTAGRVLFEGHPIERPSTRVSMMFQSSVLLPWRRVIDNVLLPVDVRRLPRREHVDEARSLLEQVGLAAFERSYPRELSGGMQQRAALCQALILRPSLLLLDEPFGSLDSITREQMNALLADVRGAEPTTTLLVTHDIDEATYLADRVVIMSPRPGRIVADVEIDLPRPRLPDVRSLPSFADHTAMLRKMLGVGRIWRQGIEPS